MRMAGEPVSPLAEIERAVQERAKDISLEMAASGGEAKLRALIVDEVARWNDDHRRGRRAVELPDPELVVERAFRNLARYGPLTPLLADDDVWEVMVNAPEGTFGQPCVRCRGPTIVCWPWQLTSRWTVGPAPPTLRLPITGSPVQETVDWYFAYDAGQKRSY